MDSNFDLAPIASLNAQLAGVLAALAFTTLLLYLAQNKPSGQTAVHTGVTSLLFAAFFGLTTCAINYSEVAAMPPVAQAHVLLVAHTPGFSIAIIALFLALAVALHGKAYMRVTGALAKIVIVVLGPFLALGHGMLGIFTIYQNACKGCSYLDVGAWYTTPTTWGMVIMVVTLVITLAFLRLPTRMQPVPVRIYTQPAYVIVAMALVDFVLQVVISFTSLDYNPPPSLFIAWQVVIALVLIGFSYLCVRALRYVPQELA